MDDIVEMKKVHRSDYSSQPGSIVSLAMTNSTHGNQFGSSSSRYSAEAQSPPFVDPCPDMSLHKAAREGREDVVQQWMKVDKSGVDTRDGEGHTAFHYAAEYHCLKVMRILVANGADPTLDTLYPPRAALHLAAGSKLKAGEQESQAIRESMKYLVDELKFNVNHVDFDKYCPLYYACSSGNITAVDFLLDQENILLDLVDDWKSSILHASCYTDNVKVLQLVLEKLEEKGQLSYMLPLTNGDGRTALDVALIKGHLQVACKLLEFARNDEYSEIDPQLVLDCSQGKETDAIVEFLNTCDLKCLSRRDDGASILHLLVERGWARAAGEVAVNDPSLLNKKDSNGRTSLHYAATKNDGEIVELLINQKITEVDAVDKDECTPLLVAARQGCSEAFAKLLEKADLNKTDSEGRNVVFLAAEADHSAILEAAKGKDPSTFRQVDNNKNTPLHAAAEHGSEKALKILLDEHVNVNAHNKYRMTALHLAVWSGNNGVVNSLLAYIPPSDGECGQTAVDVFARDMDGYTALHLAAKGGHSSVAVTLLNKGANIRARNTSSKTPLHYCAGRGHYELVELFVSEHGAEVDARDDDKQTPLHWAARWGHCDVVTVLLNHKADLAAVDKDGKNALAVAIEERHGDVAMAIVKHGDWNDAMRHTYQQGREGEGPETTPMREMIKDMPDVALEVLNNCTKVEDHARKGPSHVNYKVTFDCVLLEDLRQPELPRIGTTGVPGEATDNASIPQQPRRGKHQPSYLFNQLALRLCTSKKKGQYTTWGPTLLNKATHPLQLMVKHQQTILLDHPLISSLIAYKWKRTWPLYLANILFYMVFLSFLTAYVIVVPNPQSELCECHRNAANRTCANASIESPCDDCNSNEPFLYAAGAIVLLCVLVRVIMEFLQFLEQPVRYFLSRENWLELLLYSFTVVFMSSLWSDCVCPEPWQWQIGALAIFLGWIHLCILIRKLPQLGLYIIMFEDIVLTFIKLAIPALLLLLAFSMAFYMTFHVPCDDLFSHSPFANAARPIVKVMTMAIGEMEFENIFRLNSGGENDVMDKPEPIPYAGVSYLLWILFLILIPILLMNLLTGLAVGDVDRIQSEAEYRKQELQIQLVLKMEETFQAFHAWFTVPLDKHGNKPITIKPNQHRHRQRFGSLLAGVDKNLTGEDISDSLLNPVKNITVEHVHEQTTALLAKVAEQGTEQKEAATELSKDVKKAIAEQRTEKLGGPKEIMAEQRVMNSMLESEMAELKTAMAGLKSEVDDLKRAMSEQFQCIEVLLLRSLAGRTETGGADGRGGPQ